MKTARIGIVGWAGLLFACTDVKETGRADLGFYGVEPKGAVEVDGAAGGEFLGSAVAGLDDLNGDKIGEIAAGAPGADSDKSACPDAMTRRGVVRIVSGKDGAVVRTHCGNGEREAFGQFIRTLGDVDGDGVRDYAISAPAASSDPTACPDNPDTSDDDLPGRGVVRLFSGKSGNLIRAFCGQSRYENMGSVVTDVGDLNGDKLSDFIVASPNASTHSQACPERPTDAKDCPLPKAHEVEKPCFRGYVEGRSGKDGTLLFTSCGERPSESYGSWVVRSDSTQVFGGQDFDKDNKLDLGSARDLDQDGKTDLVVGTGAEGCYVLSSTANWAPSLQDCNTVLGLGTYSGLDPSPGDLDGDGTSDLIIGNASAPGFGGVCPQAAILGGIAQVFLVIADKGPTRASVVCGSQGDTLGTSVDILQVGDADGDSKDDPDWIVVGAPGFDLPGKTNAGGFLVFSVPPAE